MLVPKTLTPWTLPQLRAAYRQAWRDVLGGDPSDACVDILSAQSVLECGWNGEACRNHNPSNMMTGEGYEGAYFVARAPECGDLDALPAGATVLAESQVACAPGDVPYQPANASTWRAYATLADGCRDKLRRLLAQWPDAIVALQAAVSVDDAFAFVAGLRSYFTASADTYARSIRSIAASLPSPTMSLPEAHLPTVNAPRSSTSARAYRLNEPAMPVHDGTAESALRIVEWLGVERNARWQPGGGTTFCNVYAGDLCALLGAYIPRVWWLPAALADFGRGKQPTARYAATVGELSANALYRWLAKWAESFGWYRADTLDEAQAAANEGHAVVICARRTVEAASGHISVVVPESPRCVAMREGGRVVRPVQSQAGGRNVEVGTLGSPWWAGAEMAEWGCWIHRGKRDTIPAPSDGPVTEPSTPTSKSSGSMRAVDWSPQNSGAATPLRAGEGEHTHAHLRDDEPPGAA